MRLLDIIAFGPNTFGAHRKSGGDSEVLIKMSLKTQQTTKTQRLFFFPPPRAVPGIQIDKNRENKEKRGHAQPKKL
jgi:hypothetical protein